MKKCRDCLTDIEKGIVCNTCLKVIRSKTAKKLYEDRPELKEQRSRENLKRFEDPATIEKQSVAMKKRYENQEEREAQRQRMVKRYEDPAEREKLRLQALGNKSRTGQTRSVEEKRKTSIALKNHYATNPSTIVRVSLNSKHMWDSCPEYRQQASVRLKSRNMMNWIDPIYVQSRTKENHWNWKGGSSQGEYDSNFTPKFKRFIRRRQSYKCADYDDTCITCGIALAVHHIDGNKKNSTPDNCIALCKSHHHRAHNDSARIRHKTYVASLNAKGGA